MGFRSLRCGKLYLVKVKAWLKYYFDKNKFDIEFSVVTKVLLSIKHLNIIGDRRLLTHFVGSFFIVQWVEHLAYYLNLGNCYSRVHPIFYISLLKPFCAGGDDYPHPTAVYIKDQQK